MTARTTTLQAPVYYPPIPGGYQALLDYRQGLRDRDQRLMTARKKSRA